MNNINFNVSNTSHSSSISLIDEVSNSNISFFISDTALYSKDIKDIQLDSLVTAYDLDNKAILEATTYSNSLLLGVNTLNETDIQAEANIELISEDINRIAVKSNDELIAQITAIKVIDESGKELRSSMHIQENGIELVIEEEMTKATVVIEFAPYIEFINNNAIYLNTFGEYDYWYYAGDYSIYKVNKYNHKELYIKFNYNQVGSNSSYPYYAPSMISETVVFLYYSKAFYKIGDSGLSLIKSGVTDFFGLIPLYDNVWLTAYRDTPNNSYVYQIIEFTDIETATYEVRDTHTVEVGKSVNEQFYCPFVIYNYDDKLAVGFLNYALSSSYTPATDQYLCAKIDKENKCFNLDGIEPMYILAYEDDEYRLELEVKNKDYYVNGTKVSGYLSFVSKPLTLKNEDNTIVLYSVSNNCASSNLSEIDLENASITTTKTFTDKMFQNGSYAGVKSVNRKSVTEAWDVFKDVDIKKRSARPTTMDDYIVPEEKIVGDAIYLDNQYPVYLKKEVIQNKKFLFVEGVSIAQLLQKDRIIPSSITVTENTDIEIRSYLNTYHYPFEHFILTEEKDFNIYEAVIDTKRIAKNEIYDLQINEDATIFDKVDNKNDISFTQWQYNTESFEGEPLIDFRGNATSFYTRDELAVTGSKSLFMTAEYRGREYIEFDTVSDSISLKYYPHTKKYNSEFYVYINGIEQGSYSDYWYDKWEELSFKLNPQEKSTIKLEYYKSASIDDSRYNGCFIDDISCNMLSNTTEATVYFNTYDLAMYNSSQAVHIKFNDLEISDNVEQTIYYSTNAGTTWTLFKGTLPNEDNLLLKAVFTKPTADEEAHVRFSSVTVMPGELDWVTNIDTSRKVYDTSDIVPELIENVTVSKGEENRYNITFNPEVEAIETFDNDYKVIDYALNHTDRGTVEITNEDSYSGRRCLKYIYTGDNSDYSRLNIPSFSFKTTANKLTFRANQITKVGDQYADGMFLIYVNGSRGNRDIGLYQSSSFVEHSVNLVVEGEKEVFICYTSRTKGGTVLIDDITLDGETVTLGIDPYIETDIVDLSIFPSDITCELVTDDLQASHDLNTQYFYTINDGQDWLEFNKTLPNNSNVRLKAVFTKDTEEEVIASFKNLIIRQDDGSTIKANIRLATTRTVHASNDKSYETSREVVNTANPVVYTERQVYKDVDTTLTTNRKTAINDETTILTQREVVRVNTVRRSLDTIRHIHKSLINSLDATRNVSNNTSSIIDTKVVVTNSKEAVIDTERQVWNIIEVDKRIDTTRIVYITASSFVTQLNIDLKLSKGTLLLDNQEFN